MCNLETEGTKYGCGHYVKTRDVRKLDCGRSTCTLSARHPVNCKSPECNLYYGPDRKETITYTTEEYCPPCHYWFKTKRGLR
ncbi:hypothetical protein E1B28_000490 [Marasmius oreades]|uniref:Uncharacterized protein n=1 Tax=Marasmius oreades TaxID=181124 RepID=A0A9P7V1D0_9AGAR|nr:uncharacterized protein E1B28_000490 [Marasmius oreades]KAG7098556.1 hypothetical protein E1B28_000490 [Marasmius oreades]